LLASRRTSSWIMASWMTAPKSSEGTRSPAQPAETAEVADEAARLLRQRTIGQAEALDRHLEARAATLDAACYLEVPDDELWRRLLDRGRGDDEQRVVRHRLAVFAARTRPLLDH
jgi:hypothetical protein